MNVVKVGRSHSQDNRFACPFSAGLCSAFDICRLLESHLAGVAVSGRNSSVHDGIWQCGIPPEGGGDLDRMVYQSNRTDFAGLQ